MAEWLGPRGLARMAAVAALMLGPGLAPALSAEDGDTKPPMFELADVFDLEYAADPQIAPDGSSIVYVRRSMDIRTDRAKGSLWTIAPDGSRHRPLLADAKSYGSPRWSPDGTRIAYVTAAEGSPQIYVRWMDTGQTAKIADLTEAPGNLAWSPDGTRIAFTMAVDAKPASLATLPSPPEGAEWAPPPVVIDRLTYRADGAGFLPHSYTHVFVVPAEGGTPRQVTSGDFNHGGTPSWMPDGTSLIVSANRMEDWDYHPNGSELFEVSLAEGTVTPLTDRDGADFAPSVSPNGRYVAYLGYDDQGTSNHQIEVMVLDRRTGEARALTEGLDRTVTAAPAWGGGNSGVYFLYEDRGTTKIAYVTLGGSVSDLADGIGGTTLGRPYTSGDFSVARTGAYATVLTAPDHPADLAASPSRQGTLKRLTELNADLFGHKTPAASTEITFPSSFDGQEIQAWYLTPPGFDPEKQYPLIIEIHGGPHTAYGPNFTAEGQLFASAGYVVLFVNPRGSTSYGLEFANYIDKNYPSEDHDDLMSGVDAMIETGFIDPDQLFITGGSGGGTLTAWAIGKTDRFKAAVVAKPVINWTSFTLTADAYSYFTQYWFTEMPWDDPDQYWDRSPLSLVGNVSTPTMLLTGEDDLRTPITETEQYYQALKLRKIDTAMVRIPGASHGIAARPSQLMAKAGYIIAWFDKYREMEDDSAGDAAE